MFGNIKVRYEFKKEPIVHLIEVYPKEVYQSNEDYISWESKLYDKFTEQYPLENICFISEDALSHKTVWNIKHYIYLCLIIRHTLIGMA